MPMTQTKAQELFDTYQAKLLLVQAALNTIDASEYSVVSQLISTLLKALPVIAKPSTASDAYSFEQAQAELESKFNKQDKMSETTFAYLAKTYDNRAQDFYTLENEIRAGLKAELVVESPVVSEPDTTAPSPVVEPGSNYDAPQAVEFVEGFDLSFWLKVASLSVALVASIALSIAAVMMANPVLLGAGVVATAASGVALARTLGFFNSNPVTPEVPPTQEEKQGNSPVGPTPTE